MIRFMILNRDVERKPSQTIVGKEKMLVTTIFSISHNIFYIFQTKFQFLATFPFSSANPFN